MTQPENFTSAQASDPQTPGQVLADIAALRPDLRVAVASNPSTYPGLLEWLRGLGEPAVDAAIAARRAAVQQTQQMPMLPPAAPPAPSWAGQPAAQAPAPMVTPGYSGMPPQGGAPQYAGMPPQRQGSVLVTQSRTVPEPKHRVHVGLDPPHWGQLRCVSDVVVKVPPPWHVEQVIIPCAPHLVHGFRLTVIPMTTS